MKKPTKVLTCKDCGEPITSPSDIISFKKVNQWVVYHRKCYADRFDAPHALNK